MTDSTAEAEIQAVQDRWQRMWSHREELLRVARRRSMSQEDAEDAVHEAMLRAAERPDLDDDRLAAWLTTVTMRLCVDRYRQVSREAEVHRSPTLVAPGPVPVEEVVCDRAEARWLAVRSGELPARQAEALRLKSQDLDVGQVAHRMGLSYRTVESLLARARRTLRNSLAGTLGLALFLWGRGRPRTGGHAPAVAVASTAVTLAVAGLVLPYDHDDAEHRSAAPRTSVAPAPQETGPSVRQHPYGEGRGPERDARPVAGPAPRDPRPAPGRTLRLPVPTPVPDLPDLAPTPTLQAPALPTAQVPALPDTSALPALPDDSAIPALPALPEPPAPPGTPEAPDLTQVTGELPQPPAVTPAPTLP
ncbi:sigma-70 family RNA polymerase sigma factor [Streptomyces sp. NPDC052676]|uniref:RNA polymerase sigma factor n=1 Tax=Streptomyces sp. NPDC052676 TaxID=3154953 RepID=UPI00342925C2